MEKYDFIKEVPAKNELIGRREELALLKESMFKKRMKNTILVGEAGCGKTAILEQFAYDMRHHFNLIELDIGACVAGTSLRGQFEEKLINFLSEIAKYNKDSAKKTIIFIDEIHTLYNAGGGDGAIDASNIIKSYLSRGEIIVIGATTRDEYEATIKKDKALNRRLSPLFIKELDEKTILEILIRFNDGLLSEDTVKYIYEKSKTLKGSNPDKAIEILDRCMAKKKYTGKYITPHMINQIINFMKEGMI